MRTVRVMTVWPGGEVELPDPPLDEAAFRVVTTARTSGEGQLVRPRRSKKALSAWLANYLETSRNTGKN